MPQLARRVSMKPFDVVWSVESISHYPNNEKFFAGARNLLKPNGRMDCHDSGNFVYGLIGGSRSSDQLKSYLDSARAEISKARQDVWPLRASVRSRSARRFRTTSRTPCSPASASPQV